MPVLTTSIVANREDSVIKLVVGSRRYDFLPELVDITLSKPDCSPSKV